MPRRCNNINYENQTAECTLCKKWKPWPAFTCYNDDTLKKMARKKPISSMCNECGANRMAQIRAKERQRLGIPEKPPSDENIELRVSRCTRCKETKPFSEFPLNTNNGAKRITRSRCISCSSALRKEYRQKSPDKNAETLRRWREDPNNRAAILCREKRCHADKGLRFELTKEWYQERMDSGVCEATGLPLDLRIPDIGVRGAKSSPYSPEVDQIQAKGGYTIANSRLVCTIFNSCKNQWSEDHVEAMCVAYLKKKGFTVTPPEGWSPTYEAHASPRTASNAADDA